MLRIKKPQNFTPNTTCIYCLIYKKQHFYIVSQNNLIWSKTHDTIQYT